MFLLACIVNLGYYSSKYFQTQAPPPRTTFCSDLSSSFTSLPLHQTNTHTLRIQQLQEDLRSKKAVASFIIRYKQTKEENKCQAEKEKERVRKHRILVVYWDSAVKRRRENNVTDMTFNVEGKCREKGKGLLP